MTEQDTPKLKEIMNRVGIITDKPMTKSHYDTYFELLKGFSIEQVAGAFTEALKKNTFFPRPAELLEILEGNDDDRASYAWSAFLSAAKNGGYASVKFLDAATAIAVDQAFGGWIQACQKLAAGWVDDFGKIHDASSDEMITAWRNHFFKVYAAARRSHREVELYRPGLSELSMRDPQKPLRGDEMPGEWKSRMTTLIQSVLLIGFKETREIKLPFDVQAGTLTDAAKAALAEGPKAAIALAESLTPRRALAAVQPEQKALKAAPQPPATREEIAAILAEAKAKLADKPKAQQYLRLLEENADAA